MSNSKPQLVPHRAEIDIGKVITDAIVFNPRNTRGRHVTLKPLRDRVDHLFTLLHERKIPYVLVGGIAMLVYVEGRNTEDIDVIMSVASLRRLPEIVITEQDSNFARGFFGELQVDVLLSSNKLFEAVRRRYTVPRHISGRQVPCVTVEGLVLLKLYALPSLYRQGNFARVGLYENDIATLLHDYHPDLGPILNELARYLSDTDMAAVRQILDDVEQRIERFGRGMDTER